MELETHLKEIYNTPYLEYNFVLSVDILNTDWVNCNVVLKMQIHLMSMHQSNQGKCAIVCG